MKSITNKKILSKEDKIKLLKNESNLGFTNILELVHATTNHNEVTDLSASSITKTVRQTIFRYRYPELQYNRDILDNSTMSMSLGNARHAYVEQAWKDKDTIKAALQLDNLDPNLANAMLYNPPIDAPKVPNALYIYSEYKLPLREVNGLIIGGTPDLIFNGQVMDYKTTSPFALMYPGSVNAYVMQMSAYRWLAPDIITKDTGVLLMRYPKWDKKDAMRIKDYPRYPMENKSYELYSLEFMDDYIDKLSTGIVENLNVPDEALPPCPEDIIEISKEYKVYSSVDNYNAGKRAGRTFNNKNEAIDHCRTMKSGALVEFISPPKMCSNICPFTSVCNQFLLLNKESETILKVW